ncbi:zinc-ribbon domain-containing protein [Methanobrevibacter arboriphilus]|nr:zinc-ribbon domain-containing protein [Methanobrevibacter arboriphilus]
MDSYCPECGKKLEEGSDFCSDCGTKVNSESVNDFEKTMKVLMNKQK